MKVEINRRVLKSGTPKVIIIFVHNLIKMSFHSACPIKYWGEYGWYRFDHFLKCSPLLMAKLF